MRHNITKISNCTTIPEANSIGGIKCSWSPGSKSARFFLRYFLKILSNKMPYRAERQSTSWGNSDWQILFLEQQVLLLLWSFLGNPRFVLLTYLPKRWPHQMYRRWNHYDHVRSWQIPDRYPIVWKFDPKLLLLYWSATFRVWATHWPKNQERDK